MKIGVINKEFLSNRGLILKLSNYNEYHIPFLLSANIQLSHVTLTEDDKT